MKGKRESQLTYFSRKYLSYIKTTKGKRMRDNQKIKNTIGDLMGEVEKRNKETGQRKKMQC